MFDKSTADTLFGVQNIGFSRCLHYFNVIAIRSNLSHLVFIFCARSGWLFSAISLESCKHCFAMLFSGKCCKWIQN